jgi:phosphoglycerate dehydrogenase-like enzyme
MMIKFLSVLICFLAITNAYGSSQSDDPAVASSAAAQAMIEELGLRESDIASSELPGWSKPEKAIIRSDNPDRLVAFQAVAPGVEIVLVETLEQAVAAVGNAQVVIGFCREELLAKASSLHWLQVYSSGVDRCIEYPSLHRDNLLLTNGQRIASPALAEHAIALMMALVRGLDLYHGNQVKGLWTRDVGIDRRDFMELDGRTVLVVGLGGIGTQTAKRAHGLGMRVVATRGSRRDGLCRLCGPGG